MKKLFRYWFTLPLILACAIAFSKTIFWGSVPFPGDLLLSEYTPWRQSSYFGYAAGAVPSKAQYFDVIRELYPWKHLAIDELKKGRWPLWNPYNFSGTPLLANYQTSVFYPMHLLYLVLPQIPTWTILILLQPVLGSLFAYLYGRQIGLSALAAVFSALLFNFGSFATVWSQFGTVWHTILWLPLLLWLVEKSIAVKTVSPRHTIFFVFALFSSITAGHPQDFLNVFFFWMIYLVLRLKASPENRTVAVRLLVTFCILSLYSFLLAGAQLLPTIELFIHSSRAPHDYLFLIDKLLIRPWQLVMVPVQDFFGNPSTRSYMLDDTYVNRSLSIGVVGFFFAVTSLFVKRKSWHRKYFLATAAAILLLTVRTPVAELFYRIPIPIFSTATPTRMLFLFLLGLSVAAGFGLDDWMKAKKTAPLFLYVSIFGFLWISYLVLKTTSVFPLSPAQLTVMKRALLFASAFGGTTTLLILFSPARLRTAGIVFLAAIELAYGYLKFNPFVPPSFIFPGNDVLGYLKSVSGINRFWGYGTGRIESNFTTQYGLFSPDGTDPLNLRTYNEFVQTSGTGTFPSQFTHTNRSDAAVAPGYGPEDLPSNKNRLRVLDLLGVKYILDRIENPKDDATFSGDRFRKIWEHPDGWIIYENLSAAPRYFLTDQVDRYGSAREFEEKFFNPAFAPGITVLVQKNEPLPLLSPDQKKSIQLTEYEPSRVRFTTQTASPQLLFLSDAYATGWNAYIENTPQQVIRADYAFRAVLIPEGNHTVTLRYEPPSFSWGMIMSVLAGGIGMLYVVTRITSRSVSFQR